MRTRQQPSNYTQQSLRPAARSRRYRLQQQRQSPRCGRLRAGPRGKRCQRVHAHGRLRRSQRARKVRGGEDGERTQRGWYGRTCKAAQRLRQHGAHVRGRVRQALAQARDARAQVAPQQHRRLGPSPGRAGGPP